jgi:hypothetical protein
MPQRARSVFGPTACSRAAAQQCAVLSFRQIRSWVAAHVHEISTSAWLGLPELTQADGAVCADSCPTQVQPAAITAVPRSADAKPLVRLLGCRLGQAPACSMRSMMPNSSITPLFKVVPRPLSAWRLIAVREQRFVQSLACAIRGWIYVEPLQVRTCAAFLFRKRGFARAKRGFARAAAADFNFMPAGDSERA